MFSFTTISFYMCALYYFYFLSSRVIQLTQYFRILLVLIFIVNQNLKLLNRHSILIFFCALAILLSVFFSLLLVVLLLFYNYYLFITVIIYSLIYLLIHIYYHLFIYFVVLICIQYNLSSPLSREDLLLFILHTFIKFCKMKYVNLIKEYTLLIVHCSLSKQVLLSSSNFLWCHLFEDSSCFSCKREHCTLACFLETCEISL